MAARRLNPSAVELDLNNAALLATASNLAYEKDRRKLRAGMRKLGFPRSRTIMEDDTELVVGRSDDAILIAFRGTEAGSLKDWATDANITLTGGPLGMVHEGFADALALVWRQLLQAVDDYQDRGQPLWLTGHSLGGALATLAAARFLERDRPVQGVYTFGSPRVGSSSFVERFDRLIDGRAFRFVNNNDIVTRMPSRIQMYRHVSRIYYFDHVGELDETSNGWDRFRTRLIGRIRDVGSLGPDGAKDHSMDGYETLVAGAATRSEGTVT